MTTPLSLGLPTALVAGLFDDAATFPPGDLPLDQALRAHRAHLHAEHAALVGPLVVPATGLPLLARFVVGQPIDSLRVNVTASSAQRARDAIVTMRAIGAAHLTALEITAPADQPAAEVLPSLRGLVGHPHGLDVYVEVPRDERRGRILADLAGSPYRAKLRTGGLDAASHPDEQELAEAISALVAAGVAFKATAGLHHAVRCTDPTTGFEQHGFLNVLLATHAAAAGGSAAEVRDQLATRDVTDVARRVRALGPRGPFVRQWFRSVGTCSIHEPVAELRGLGLLAPADRAVAR